MSWYYHTREYKVFDVPATTDLILRSPEGASKEVLRNRAGPTSRLRPVLRGRFAAPQGEGVCFADIIGECRDNLNWKMRSLTSLSPPSPPESIQARD